jgi:hypothetical protein
MELNQTLDQAVDKTRLISRRAHRMVDYPFGAMLMAAPLLFRTRGPEAMVPAVLGTVMGSYSAMTDDDFSPVGVIDMKTHIALDLAAGTFLAASPWIFGFSRRMWLPHVLLGVTEILIAALTDPEEDGWGMGQGRSGYGQSALSEGEGIDLAWVAEEDIAINEPELSDEVSSM